MTSSSDSGCQRFGSASSPVPGSATNSGALTGIVLGSISGYFGGIADIVVQRIIEVLVSIPSLPLWMALSAAIPLDWSVYRVLFVISIILSLLGWSGLAR